MIAVQTLLFLLDPVTRRAAPATFSLAPMLPPDLARLLCAHLLRLSERAGNDDEQCLLPHHSRMRRLRQYSRVSSVFRDAIGDGGAWFAYHVSVQKAMARLARDAVQQMCWDRYTPSRVIRLQWKNSNDTTTSIAQVYHYTSERKLIIRYNDGDDDSLRRRLSAHLGIALPQYRDAGLIDTIRVDGGVNDVLRRTYIRWSRVNVNTCTTPPLFDQLLIELADDRGALLQDIVMAMIGVCADSANGVSRLEYVNGMCITPRNASNGECATLRFEPSV